MVKFYCHTIEKKLLGNNLISANSVVTSVIKTNQEELRDTQQECVEFIYIGEQSMHYIECYDDYFMAMLLSNTTQKNSSST